MDIKQTLQSFVSEPPDLPIQYSHPAPDALTQFATGASTTTHPSTATPAGRWYALSLQAHELHQLGGFDALVAPDLLAPGLVAHPHQLRVVHQVLREKAPAAVLADEVGLGKTIEAGLILKELIIRGLVRTALVVTPKALVLQWQSELREHFNEAFDVPDQQPFPGYAHTSRLICSFEQLVRAFAQIGTRPWDCLIVDEAHLLANPESKRRQNVAQISGRWKLFLTATPIQNKVTDLYSLVDLVNPGRFGTLRQFINVFVADPGTCRHVVPSRLPELRRYAQEVMCRTRREETGITFPTRSVQTLLVAPQPLEAGMIQAVTSYLRTLYRRELMHTPTAPAAPRHSDLRGIQRDKHGTVGRSKQARTARSDARSRSIEPGSEPSTKREEINHGALIREIVTLQQSLSSSPQAIAASLHARAFRHPEERATLDDLAHKCERTSSAKEKLLLETLQQLGSESALIFTLRLETAHRLRTLLASSGHSAECYIGALSIDERRDVIQRFNAGTLQTLIATDAGAEGLNLQERCRVVVNYDLHWNPMKMEQRIGRVHRLGQHRDVMVANLALAGSIDEHVLTLLYQKIDLFTMTIGALDSVLANIQDGEVDIETRIVELLMRDEETDVLRSSAHPVCIQLDLLAQELSASRSQLHGAETLTAEVLG